MNPTLGFALGDKGNLVFGYEHARDDRVIDRGGPSLGGRPAKGFRDTFFGLAGVNRSTFNADVVSLALDYQLTDTLTLRQRSRYGDYDKFYSNLFAATAISAANSATKQTQANWVGRHRCMWPTPKKRRKTRRVWRSRPCSTTF